jgi:hypothetical protein
MSTLPHSGPEVNPMSDATAPTLAELCDRHGITLEAVRLPSKREGKIGFLRFHVTIRRGPLAIESEYSMGEGHIKVPASVGPRGSVDGAAYVAAILAKPDGVRAGGSVVGAIHSGPLPTAADIVASLISDASCYEDSRDLEDFAANFGGEIKIIADAKKIEASYLACGETAKRLRSFLGADLEAFQEAARDY